MTTTIQLSDWDAVSAELKQFGATGAVSISDDSIRVTFGTAYIEVTKEGTISTGMPLHNLEHSGAVDVVVDHDDGSITIESASLRYTFRRP